MNAHFERWENCLWDFILFRKLYNWDFFYEPISTALLKDRFFSKKGRILDFRGFVQIKQTIYSGHFEVTWSTFSFSSSTWSPIHNNEFGCLIQPISCSLLDFWSPNIHNSLKFFSASLSMIFNCSFLKTGYWSSSLFLTFFIYVPAAWTETVLKIPIKSFE